MHEFSCEARREYNGNGKLTAIVVEWAEQRVVIASAALFFLIGGALLAVQAPIFAFVSWRAFAWMFGVSIALLWIGFEVRTLSTGHRSLAFLADGTMTAPHGLPRHPAPRTLRTRQPEISTFECWELQWQWLVILYTRQGDAFTIAGGLNQWQAAKVAVQLNAARQELRDSVSRPGTAAAGAGVSAIIN